MYDQNSFILNSTFRSPEIDAQYPSSSCPWKFSSCAIPAGAAPRIRQTEYKRRFLSNVVRDYFTGSYKEMVSFFVRDRKLSKEDLQELMEQIEREE